MIRHVVLFRWIDGTTDDEVAGVVQALQALPGAIPEIRAMRVGPDVGVNDGNWDFAVVADFDSIEDQCTYRDHPAHQRVIHEVLAPIRADRAAVQYEVR